MVDLDRRLDEHVVTPRLVAIVLLCFLVMLVDSFDLFVTSQLLPAIAQSYHATTATLAASYSAQIFGQALGALSIGPLADRFGRRPALLAVLGLFGLANLSSVLCVDPTQFAISRFLGGALGGGLMPIAISLVADIAPSRSKGRLIGLAYAGLAVGPLLTAVVTRWLLEPYGWRSAYWIGGAAPLLLWPLILGLFPESPRHLARLNPHDPKISGALKRLGVDTSGAEAGFATKAAARTAPVVGLFREGRAAMTLMLWLCAGFSLVAVTLIGLFATFFHDFAGVPLTRFAGVLAVMLTGSILAVFLTGWAVDKIGGFRALFVLAILGAVSLVTLGSLEFATIPFAVAAFCCGFCIAGTQTALNVVGPTLYPATMRATAVGWKTGLSRVASSAAPLIGGVLLTSHAGVQTALVVTALPLIVLAIMTPVLAFTARRGGVVLGAPT